MFIMQWLHWVSRFTQRWGRACVLILKGSSYSGYDLVNSVQITLLFRLEHLVRYFFIRLGLLMSYGPMWPCVWSFSRLDFLCSYHYTIFDSLDLFGLMKWSDIYLYSLVWILTKWMEWHGTWWNAFHHIPPFYSIFHSS